MTQSNATVGTAFAAGCAVLTASAVLVGSVLLRSMSALDMVTFAYVFGVGWHALFHLAVGRSRAPLRLGRPIVTASATLGLIDASYNVALLSGLAVLGAPVHGFYSLLGELFAAALGIAVLRERYNVREALSGGVVVAGLLVVRAHAGAAGASHGLPWMLVAALAFGISATFSRRVLRAHSPTHVAFLRTVSAAALLLVVWSVKGGRTPVGTEWALLALMGFVAPFLNALFFYHALQRIDVSRVVTLRMAYVVLVPLGAWSFFGARLAPREIVGGALMLVGCAILVREREHLRTFVRETPALRYRPRPGS